MIRPQPIRGIPIYFERYLEWEIWGMPDRIIAGRESFPQLVFAYQVKDTILVTDPGPLDARVP